MTIEERNRWVKNLQTWEHLYVPFSMATKLPFLTCDEKTFNDQAHLFTKREELSEFAAPYLEQKYAVSGVEIDKEQRLRFFLNLVTIGANTIVVHGEANSQAEIELSEIIRVEEDTEVPEKQRPLFNPQLQLSAIYFMQEIRRGGADLTEPRLKEMEEEVSANAVRSEYLMPVQVVEPKGIRFPYLEDKESKKLQPVFTDGTELQKFVKDKKMNVLKIPFAGLLKYATEESYGFAINPLGINLIIRKEQIPAMIKRFE